MKTIRASTLGAAWLAACRHVLGRGRPEPAEAIREALHLTLVVARPDPADPTIARAARRDVLAWMRANFAEAGPVRELGDAPSYAARLRDLHGRDQVAWVVRRLREKPGTKSATITTLRGDDEVYVPCVSLLDFKLRAGRLLVTCACRSIDVGTKLPANLVELARLQAEVAAAVGTRPGPLVLWIASAHVYDRERPRVRRLLTRFPVRAPRGKDADGRHRDRR